MGLACLATLVFACDFGGLGGRDRDRRVTVSPASARRAPGTLVVGRPIDAISLDPGRVTDNESAEVCEQIYDKLLTYRPGSSRIEPGLAQSWEMAPDGLSWTFHLRPHVKFHDGTPLDAAAVVFSLERQRDTKHPYHRPDRTGQPFYYWESMYKNVRKVEATGPLTVRITLDRPYAPFEANMAMFPVSIVSPTAVKRWGRDYYKHPVGTGPFRFSEWKDGRIVLTRNPDYWGQKPAIKRLVFRAVPDGRQRLTELESGAIDLAYSIVPDELQFVELHPDLLLYRAAANNVAYLAMNETHPPFNDVRVRRAINYAINKVPIVKLAYQGLATPAVGPLPPTQWGYHKPADLYQYDPIRARALLAEAQADGVFDPSVRFKFYVPETPRPYLPNPEMVARVLQANLAEVGIQTQLVVQPMRAHTHSLQRGDHDLCLFGWVGDNGDPDNFLYMLLDADNTIPGLARNVAFDRDPVLHHMLVAAQQSMSRPTREALYRKAQDRIAAEAPWVPLAHSQVAVAARVDVRGIVVMPSTHVDFRGVSRIVR